MRDLAALGLIYDIAGVAILARALFGPRTLALRIQAASFFGGNKSLFRALLLQRTDAQFGLPILIAGFALQLAGALGGELAHPYSWSLLAPLVIVLAIYLVTRSSLRRRSDEIYDDTRLPK